MTSALFTDLLCSTALLSVFLLLGTFLRAKIPLFQKTFLPASVIGGFLLLLLGPIVFGILPIPQGWLETYSLLPGILIVPIVASVPLGLKMGGNGGGGGSSKNIIPLFCIMCMIGLLQYAVGFGTQIAFNLGGADLYPSFGWELGLGFSGGHGTAGLLGNMLQDMNLPYWKTAQGVAVTTATFGIIGGILLGMVLINWAARKGETSILKKPGDIPQNLRIGYDKDITKQPSAGRDTTFSSSIDSVALHLAIILSACGGAYLLLAGIKYFKVPILGSISIWAYAIVVMFAVWKIMCVLKLDFLVDSKIKSRISGTFTEYAVLAAIASLPVQAVMEYIVPILVMVVLGFTFTIFPALILCKRYIKDNWFEHMIATFGMCTGVFLTGILLLRICDPDMESPVLGNYSLAYTLNSVISFAMMPMIMNAIMSNGALGALGVSGALFVVYVAILFITTRKSKKTATV